MEPEFAYIAKEEILRNIIKTHDVVLLLGWQGAGKTVSSLRAVKGLWTPYYFNASEKTQGPDMRQHNKDVVAIGRLEDLPAGLSSDAVLIIDDFDEAAEKIVAAVEKMASARNFGGKIVITAQAQPKLDNSGLKVDAVVRMKDDTAQVLYTRLLDIS